MKYMYVYIYLRKSNLINPVYVKACYLVGFSLYLLYRKPVRRDTLDKSKI